MGLNLLMSSSENDKSRRCVSEPTIIPNQPDPGVFTIEKHFSNKDHTVVIVDYPDASNYEGKKIIVYLYTSYEQIVKERRLDPHFTSAKINVKPFARFEPTQLGWAKACDLINNI